MGSVPNIAYWGLTPLFSQPIDTSIYTIIKYNVSDDWMFEHSRPASLNTDEIIEIEMLLTACIKEYNQTQLKRYDSLNAVMPEYHFPKSQFIIELKRYKRQFIAVTNKKGEKEVWVNCFCREGEGYWRKEIVEVKDGGNCFFNLKINLKKRTFSDLRVNGVA